ncbi:uncharacterized protein [Physcomitrium patens]|uniref:uncharacterized protein isoform X3 n=1 Tax=Physcomitrium patens TaxID=3218 RepID=UPI003CCD76F2
MRRRASFLWLLSNRGWLSFPARWWRRCIAESGELETTENKWKLVKHIVQKYPPGLRSIVVKAAGMSINHSSGFHRPKFTSVKLQFVPLNEVPLCIDEPACKKFSHF